MISAKPAIVVEVLALCFIVIGPACSTTAKTEPESFSMEECDTAIDNDPDYVPAYYRRAELRAREGDFRGSKADLDEAIRIDPGMAKAWRARSGLCVALRDVEGAMADINESLRLNPRDPMALAFRGNIRLTFKRDGQGALADFIQATTLEPEDGLHHICCGLAAMEIRYGTTDPHEGKDYPELAHFRRAIQLDPGLWEAYLLVGLVNMEDGDAESAVASFTASIDHGGHIPSAYMMRSLARSEDGDLVGALEDAESAISLGSSGDGIPEPTELIGSSPSKRRVFFKFRGMQVLGIGSDAWALGEAIGLLLRATERNDQHAEWAKAALWQNVEYLRNLTVHEDQQLAERAKAALRQMRK